MTKKVKKKYHRNIKNHVRKITYKISINKYSKITAHQISPNE